MPEVKIEIKEDGSIEIEGIGYIGNACEVDVEEIMKLIEEELGIDLNIKDKKVKRSEAVYMAGAQESRYTVKRW